MKNRKVKIKLFQPGLTTPTYVFESEFSAAEVKKGAKFLKHKGVMRMADTLSCEFLCEDPDLQKLIDGELDDVKKKKKIQKHIQPRSELSGKIG